MTMSTSEYEITWSADEITVKAPSAEEALRLYRSVAALDEQSELGDYAE